MIGIDGIDIVERLHETKFRFVLKGYWHFYDKCIIYCFYIVGLSIDIFNLELGNGDVGIFGYSFHELTLAHH